MMKETFRWFYRRIDVIVILAVALIAYSPQVGGLGYYRDDWHVTWAGTMIGADKIFDLHLVDRPFMGLIYSWVYSVLGNSPLIWQWYVIFLRILGGLLLLWLFRLIWPEKKIAATWMALLFTIYPGFLQMSTASAYSNHLLGLAAGILSLVLSVKATQVSRLWHRVVLVALSILSGLTCYLIMEYMISLEGVRAILLAYLFVCNHSEALTKKWIHFLKLWSPYLAAFTVFMAWRVLFFKSARAATNVGSLASSYLAEPGYMAMRTVIETIKGIVNALFMAWSVPLYNLTMSANPTHLLNAFVLSLAVIGLLFVLMHFRVMDDDDIRIDTQESRQWGKEAILLGVMITFVNVIPIVLANRDIRLTDTMDRYTLPASIGVVMVVIGSLYWMFRGSLRLPLIGVLIGISIFTHYNNTTFFKNFWTMEKQLWWQLSWRAPDLKADTVLIPALPAPYMLAESYEVWGPANLMYGSRQTPLRIVGEALNTESMHSILTKGSFSRTIRRVQFTLDFKNSLVVSMPQFGACLRVYDGNWLEFAENESPLVRQVAPISKSSLILTDGSHTPPPVEIFGAEPEHTWCYYYEKADLARQRQDWKEAARLGDEVRSKGLKPQDAMEWMPFYEGYAYVRRMDEANDLALQIRTEEVALKDFCTQFRPERIAQLRKGSIDEFIIINLCPQ